MELIIVKLQAKIIKREVNIIIKFKGNMSENVRRGIKNQDRIIFG